MFGGPLSHWVKSFYLSLQPRTGWGWTGSVGSGSKQLCWLTATISFVTGAEEQGQWLLQFVVLVNCWIGTGPLLWWDQAAEGSYMWNRPSSQNRGNGPCLSMCGLYVCVCFMQHSNNYVSGHGDHIVHSWTQIDTDPDSYRGTDRNQPTETYVTRYIICISSGVN